MLKSTPLLVFLLTICSNASGLALNERRSFLQSAATAAAAFVAASEPANAILSAKYCAAGVGEGCEDRSEGNDFIKALQEKSAENREANLRAATLAYQTKNYPDFFAALTPPKYMVMKTDGSSFVVLTGEELEPLKKAGKIKMVQATAFGGKTVDFSQKPVMMMVE